MGGFGGVIRHGAGQVQGRSAQVATSGLFPAVERLATGVRTAARSQARRRPESSGHVLFSLVGFATAGIGDLYFPEVAGSVVALSAWSTGPGPGAPVIRLVHDGLSVGPELTIASFGAVHSVEQGVAFTATDALAIEIIDGGGVENLTAKVAFA